MNESRRIDAAIASRKQAGPDCERRVEEALATLSARRQQVTLQAVLEESGVSRSFLHSRPELRKRIPHTGHRRSESSAATRDYDQPRTASLEARLRQANSELLVTRRQLRATERALMSAGATDVLLASDSELEALKSEVGRLSVELTASRDHAARLDSRLADKEADYQAARENARDYLKELTLVRGELLEVRQAMASDKASHMR